LDNNFDINKWRNQKNNQIEDENRNFELEFEEIERDNYDDSKDNWIKIDQEIVFLISNLQPNKDEEVVVNSCEKLITLFKDYPELKDSFSTHHGVLPIIDMLEVSNLKVIHIILQVLNQIVKDNQKFQETLVIYFIIFSVWLGYYRWL
jgi:hypothetical protein